MGPQHRPPGRQPLLGRRPRTPATPGAASDVLRKPSTGSSSTSATVDMAFGAWHGDFTPWNMARLPTARATFLWDWERAAPAPAGLDLLHFLFQTPAASGEDPRAAVEICSERTPSLLPPLDVPLDSERALWLVYRLELLFRYDEARRPAYWHGPRRSTREFSRCSPVTWRQADVDDPPVATPSCPSARPVVGVLTTIGCAGRHDGAGAGVGRRAQYPDEQVPHADLRHGAPARPEPLLGPGLDDGRPENSRYLGGEFTSLAPTTALAGAIDGRAARPSRASPRSTAARSTWPRPTAGAAGSSAAASPS